MGRVVHFEILADDMPRAAAFYREALDWDVQGAGQPYMLCNTGDDGTPGINGGLMARHWPQAVITTVQIESLVETQAKIEAAGGALHHGPNEIPHVGTVAYFTDTEGNIFGVIQPADSDSGVAASSRDSE